ncbi:MAG: exonuclease domain-containing protein [candidate division Zixibacteria bacterium]|jgi:DNA polymerase III epsilon subunit family exonuclease|nr:exonuclease domain-containing protein [candidate division Zixibacteria bacterium]
MEPGFDLLSPLNRIRFVAFDTETTGLWAASNRIVEVGALAFDLEGRDIAMFTELVNPGRPIPGEVVSIHRITDSMVSDADPVGPVLARFFDFCGPDSVLIAHNAPFDISFIAWEIRRNNLPLPENPIVDTRDLARYLEPDLPSYSLLSLALKLELADSQVHRALGDADLVSLIFLKLIGMTREFTTISELFETIGVYKFADGAQVVTELPPEFDSLAAAIRDAATIEIRYAKPGQPIQTRPIRPIHIHRLGQNLYLNAQCLLAHDERTFRLDRILSWRPLKS